MTRIKALLLVYFMDTKNVSLMTLTFSCYQLFERQLAELLLVKPNVFLCEDSNFSFQIIYWLSSDTRPPLCLLSPLRHFLALH